VARRELVERGHGHEREDHATGKDSDAFGERHAQSVTRRQLGFHLRPVSQSKCARLTAVGVTSMVPNTIGN
jgi:hypothetical protein